MKHFVTYRDGNKTVLARIDDYTDPESRRNPVEVSRHDTDEEAIKKMRERNGGAGS